MYKLSISYYIFKEEIKRCKMNKIILFLIAVSIGLCAQADYTVQTYQPLYPAQPVGYPAIQPYAQQYNQQYNQGYYQNPYQAQYQGQYVNPYQYPRPYGYGNNLPYTGMNSILPVSGNTGGTQQVVKNIGQSMLYSMLRGY